MASKKQRPAPVRKILPQFATGEFLTGTQEQALTAKDRFYVDVGAEGYVIRDRKTGDVLERRTMARSEVDDECRRRNQQLPINAVRLGKLTKNPGRVRLHQQPAGDIVIPSPVQLVECIYSHPPTRRILAELVESQRPLNREGVASLLRDVLPPSVWEAMDGHDRRNKILGAVLQRLWRDFGIRRVDRAG